MALKKRKNSYESKIRQSWCGALLHSLSLCVHVQLAWHFFPMQINTIFLLFLHDRDTGQLEYLVGIRRLI